MSGSNRYIIPGYAYHLTYRCHNRKFLLKYRPDRIEYCSRLRNSVQEHSISLLDFIVTSKHVHLAVMCRRIYDRSQFMQQLKGEFASHYDLQKHRSGAFWGERFHCPMIDGGDHLWNCLRYVDLNRFAPASCIIQSNGLGVDAISLLANASASVFRTLIALL
jgi:putative transposase